MKRRSKYGNVKTTVDGITFDSRKEADRYSELKLLERTGAISDLALQPRFPIEINGRKVCTYIADFSYNSYGSRVFEDAKGMKTAVYKLKKKLVEAQYGITVVET